MVDNNDKYLKAKHYLDELFKEGIISYDIWYFMILSLRRKLGLLTI